jgi:hypothetical protein
MPFSSAPFVGSSSHRCISHPPIAHLTSAHSPGAEPATAVLVHPGNQLVPNRGAVRRVIWCQPRPLGFPSRPRRRPPVQVQTAVQTRYDYAALVSACLTALPAGPWPAAPAPALVATEACCRHSPTVIECVRRAGRQHDVSARFSCDRCSSGRRNLCSHRNERGPVAANRTSGGEAGCTGQCRRGVVRCGDEERRFR